MFMTKKHTRQIPQSRQGQRFYLKSLQVNSFANPAYDRMFIPAQNLQATFDDRLPKSALRVINFLMSRRRRNKTYLDEENQFIANCLNMSYSAVQKAMQILEWLGYIMRSVKRDINAVQNTRRRIYFAFNPKPRSRAYQNTVIDQKAEKELDAKLDLLRTQNRYAELDTQSCFQQLRSELRSSPAAHPR